MHLITRTMTGLKDVLNNCAHAVIAIAACITLGSCFGKKPTASGTLPGYKLDHPQVMKLPPELDEISGLAWQERDSSLLAIVDEVGVLYKIFPKNPRHIERWKFGPDGDYEDLAITGSEIYILRSDGALFEVKFTSDGKAATTMYEYPEKGNEFETLCYDEPRQLLLMICKDCEADKKKHLSTSAFSPATHSFVPYGHPIDANQIAKKLDEKSIKFKPSAAAFHPLTHELYIVSSVNKVLVSADDEGKIKDVVRLAPGLYKQPEGLTFSPRGTLFISNESAKAGAATILIFPSGDAP